MGGKGKINIKRDGELGLAPVREECWKAFPECQAAEVTFFPPRPVPPKDILGLPTHPNTG